MKTSAEHPIAPLCPGARPASTTFGSHFLTDSTCGLGWRGSLILQRGDKNRHGFKEVADNGKHTGAGLALVKGHNRSFRIAVEGQDRGARADIIQVLRGAADSDRQENLRIDADP